MLKQLDANTQKLESGFEKLDHQYDKGQKWHFDVTVQSLGVINSGDSL